MVRITPGLWKEGNQLEFILLAQGQHEKAIQSFELSLANNLKAYGDVHPKVIKDHNNLGLSWQELGQNRKAIQHYKLALSAELKLHGEDHLEIKKHRIKLGLALNKPLSCLN